MDRILLELWTEGGMSALVAGVVAVGAVAGITGYVVKNVRDSIVALAEVKKLVKKMTTSDYDYRPHVYCEYDITRVLSVIRHDLDADRVLVMQYHNGEKSIADNPFLRVTCTHEHLGEGVGSVQRNLTAVPMSMYGWWNKQLFDGFPVMLPEFSHMEQDAHMRSACQFLGSHHLRSLYVFPIQDARGKTFGMGMIEYTRHPVDLGKNQRHWAAGRFAQVGALLTGGEGE